MADKRTKAKQILLRISPTLWNELAQWSEDEFRSINGQIEYLLTECVKARKREVKNQIKMNKAELYFVNENI